MTTAQLVQCTKSSPTIIAEPPDHYLAARYRSALTAGKCAELELQDALAQAMAQLLQNAELIEQQQQAIDKLLALLADATNLVAMLSPRQHQVMERVVAGQPNKNIAAELGISQRAVESHRAAIMKKTGAVSLPALVRLAFVATWKCADERYV